MKGPFDACHETLEICAILDGASYSVTDGVAGTLVAGQLKIMRPGVVHSSWTEGQPVEEVVIHVQPGAVEGALPRTGTYDATPLGIDRVVQASLAERAHAVGDLLLAATRLHTETPPTDPRLTRFVLGVHGALGRSWTLEAMSDIAGCSPRTLRRLVRAHFDTTPTGWLAELRVTRACDLLRSSTLTITDVAYRVGFRSPSRFTEAFTKLRGASPSHWRVQFIGR